VVRRTNPHQLHVERLYRDGNFWNTTMLPKLKSFYYKVLLPELALPRFNTTTGIREPDKLWVRQYVNVIRKRCNEISLLLNLST